MAPAEPFVVKVLSPGIVYWQYLEHDHLKPSYQGAATTAIEQQSLTGRVGVVVESGPTIRTVGLDLLTYWLEVSRRQNVKLAAIAIVSSSAAIRVAGTGFGLLTKRAGFAVAVGSYPTIGEAVEWLCEETGRPLQSARKGVG